jgi:membrane fusion protein (multidrug efflux system)
MKLRVPLPEEFIPAVYRGQLLQVTSGEPPEERSIKISEIGIEVDPLTRTFNVFAKMENPDERLKAGLELPVKLVTDKKTKIISIPKTAVAFRKRRSVVFKINEDVVKRVLVRLGQVVGDEVSVLQGLAEGDIIVLDPPKTLKNGDQVDILTAAAETTETE